jgi:AcrR family transcriptional regulator
MSDSASPWPAGACPPSGRARPLPPGERRAALIAATLPLVAEHGMKVTTRQIADAAGVAEGTIFRVFASKEELVKAAIDAALDPEPMIAELAALDPAATLRDTMTEITMILQRRFTSIFNLLLAVGFRGPPEEDDHRRSMARRTSEAVHESVLRVLDPHSAELRLSAPEVLHVLRLLTFAASHPMINDGKPLDADLIVSVLLDGIRLPSTDQPGEHRPC